MISDPESDALGHARIVEFHKFYSEYQLWLQTGAERFRVKIRIYETRDGRFYFVQSHFLKTPLYDGTPVTHPLALDSAHLALSSAADSITTYYDDAVAQGHEPSIDWFVSNESF